MGGMQIYSSIRILYLDSSAADETVSDYAARPDLSGISSKDLLHPVAMHQIRTQKLKYMPKVDPHCEAYLRP